MESTYNRKNNVRQAVRLTEIRGVENEEGMNGKDAPMGVQGTELFAAAETEHKDFWQIDRSKSSVAETNGKGTTDEWDGYR